jgi:hypothetical protein
MRVHPAISSCLRTAAVLAGALFCASPAAADDLDGASSSVLRAGDIDRDGIDDVLVLGSGAWRGQLVALRMPSLEVLWSTFDSNPTFGENIHDVGDFDGDGIHDVTVGTSGRGGGPNVALISGARGGVILRKFGIHRAVRVPTEPPSWLVMRVHRSTAFLLPTNPQSWTVVEDDSADDVVRIDPRTDEVLACFSMPKASGLQPNGWDGAAMTTSAGTFVVLTCKDAAAVFAAGGEFLHAIDRPDSRSEFPWACVAPAPLTSRQNAHMVIATHHRRCEVFETSSWGLVRTIHGRNVTGVADAFASSVDACYERGATLPSVVVGAAETWAEGFDDGYVRLARPEATEPITLLANREFGYHACFIGDLDGDGAREIFAVEVSPTFESGRPRPDTTTAYVLDGRDGRTLHQGSVAWPFAPIRRKR